MSRESRPGSETQSSSITLSSIEKALSLVCLAQPEEDVEVESGFASDVLSEVLARAPQGCLLVTAQNNLNLVAVASHIEIAGIIVTSGYIPGGEALARAREAGIAVYSTPAQTFDVVGRLSRLGLKGRVRASA